MYLLHIIRKVCKRDGFEEITIRKERKLARPEYKVRIEQPKMVAMLRAWLQIGKVLVLIWLPLPGTPQSNSPPCSRNNPQP